MPKAAIRSAFGILLLAAGLASCGGSDAGEPTVPPLESLTPSATRESTPVTPATAAPTATPVPGGEDHPATLVALEAVSGRYVSPLTRDGCLQDNPGGEPCLELISGPATLDLGIARFRGGYPDGGLFDLVVGRTPAGQWQYWYSTQAGSYLLVELPGRLIACGAGGDLAVTAEPGGGSQAGAVQRLEPLEADGFVLLSPGTYGVAGERGAGAYHVTSPFEGWVDAHQTSDASAADCALRDAFEAEEHG